MILESPVDQGSRDHDGPRYRLCIRLADGTNVVRSFWLESGELSRGIMTGPVATLLRLGGAAGRAPAYGDGRRAENLRTAGRPAGTGIPELQCAPELEVTGKPHSPNVRLMRWREFMAMRGGSPGSMISNPLVWVVQAQGSWRSAGIVPEEARRDFSVGLVAFDADTGDTYGRSHRKEPLLVGDSTS